VTARNWADPDIERTRRVVDGLRYHRRHVMPFGCPAGCGSLHECGVGEPIDGPVDFADSAIWVTRGGAPALSSLREQVMAA
jgi:hypothetical protein